MLDADAANSKLWNEVTTGLHDYPVIILFILLYECTFIVDPNLG